MMRPTKPMTHTIPTMNHRDNAIRLLAAGFAEEFADFAAGHDKMQELMMDLAYDFVNENIPIVDEDGTFDVAHELIMNTTIRKV